MVWFWIWIVPATLGVLWTIWAYIHDGYLLPYRSSKFHWHWYAIMAAAWATWFIWLALLVFNWCRLTHKELTRGH